MADVQFGAWFFDTPTDRIAGEEHTDLAGAKDAYATTPTFNGSFAALDSLPCKTAFDALRAAGLAMTTAGWLSSLTTGNDASAPH